MQQGFINQQGLGSFFFNKNLQGLHHFEALRRDLGDLPYDTINRETLAARPFAGIVNMDCPTLFHSVEGVDRALVEFMRHRPGAPALARRDVPPAAGGAGLLLPPDRRIALRADRTPLRSYAPSAAERKTKSSASSSPTPPA